MNRSRARTKTAVVLVSGVLMTSACTGGPAPIVTETPFVAESTTPSPSPTPSPTATALTDEEIIEAIPEVARPEDFPGAQEFAKFFLAESQRAVTTGETAVLRGLSDSECVYCKNTIDYVTELSQDSETVEGGTVLSSSDMASGGLQVDGQWRVEFDATIAEQRTVASDGAVRSTIPQMDVRVVAILSRADGHWIVIDLAAAEQ